MSTSFDYPQLRPAVYLRSDLDSTLYRDVGQLPKGRRSLRLMELSRSGLRAESERIIHTQSASVIESPKTRPIKVYLRINFDTDKHLYLALLSVANRSDRLRSLAAIGLALGKIVVSPSSALPALSTVSSESRTNARALMASMVVGLTDDENE